MIAQSVQANPNSTAHGYVDRLTASTPYGHGAHGIGQNNHEGDIPSPAVFSNQEASDPNYTLICDEPENLNLVRRIFSLLPLW